MIGVAVLSGKGGTGKTLISVNIALTMLKNGYRVSLLDADFSNPNTASLMSLNIDEIHPRYTPDHRLIPISFEALPGFEYFTIEVYTRDYGVGKIGSEYGRLIEELIKTPAWTADYMIVDSPAGYYDTHKKIVESFDEMYAGSVVVAQPAHPKDLKRVLDLHRINDIPVIGVVENMSSFTCTECGKEHKIFGDGAVEEICREYGVEFFGKVPLSMEIRDRVEQGLPLLPDSMIGPIKNAVEKIAVTKPRKAGFLREFLEKIDEKIDESLASALTNLLILVNEVVPVGDFQARFNFPGGRVVRLNLLDKSMTRVLKTFDFVVRDGRIKLVTKDVKPDVQIDAYYKALAWSLLGEKKTPNGSIPYDFWRALWNDEIRVYGYKSYEQSRSWYFLQNVLQEAANRAGDRISRILEVIA
ncbi:MAG: P-loop NTPase [Nitrososphaerota archaeon]